MRWENKGKWWVYGVVLLMTCALVVAQKIGDPYSILGIHRRATLSEIRKAYRQLAKEWHPDKNENPNAEKRFVEIKQAYELLSDTERRQAYDNYGITNEDDHLYKKRHDYSQYARFSNDPFEEFFGTHFRTQDQDITLFHKLSVTTRHFENHILEKSVTTPALVLFYTDWCFDCVRVAATWRRLVEALRPLGVTLATVHAAHEAGLARRAGVAAVPSLALLLDKHVYIYSDPVMALPKVIEFMRWKFPYKMVKSITDDNVDSFVGDFEDNLVKALIFEERPVIRLRYLITAFYYRERVAFGFVDMSAADTGRVVARYQTQRGVDTMVLLKEDAAPLATVSTADIPSPALHQLLRPNQLLTLPRLSSQSVLEAVCPTEWRAARRRLCCVLVLGAGGGAAGAGRAARAGLRALAGAAPERLQYAYVYSHAQPALLAALANGSGIEVSEMEHRIVIIWRREPARIQYEWLNVTWPVCHDEHATCDDEYAPDGTIRQDILEYQERLNETKRALEQLIKRLLKPTELMAYEATIQELSDEAARGWAARLAAAAAQWAERGARGLRGLRAAPALSALATCLAVLAAGCLCGYLIRSEEESVQRGKAERRKAGEGAAGGGAGKNNNETTTELRLHEMRAEKFNGLVRLQKPGCRTIVVLVDMQSRVQLLSKFHKIVWPYRKNKTLLFAYLVVERNVEWFRRLLQLSLGGTELRLNARNCVGTVLALNPHRNYFSIYHAKNPEGAKPHKRMSRMTRSLGGGLDDPEAGAFIGFHTETDDSEPDDAPDPGPLLQENLLDGLENWLDRLFEGSTHRYYINYWPDMTTK